MIIAVVNDLGREALTIKIDLTIRANLIIKVLNRLVTTEIIRSNSGWRVFVNISDDTVLIVLRRMVCGWNLLSRGVIL